MLQSPFLKIGAMLTCFQSSGTSPCCREAWSPDYISNSACLALLGILPIKDILNKNLLNMFVNTIRDESSIEYEIAGRQVVIKDSPSESIFTCI